jgi:hypothetical protein
MAGSPSLQRSRSAWPIVYPVDFSLTDDQVAAFDHVIDEQLCRIEAAGCRGIDLDTPAELNELDS